MKPYLHANINVKKYGGTREDYLPIHDFLDSSGQAHADIRHRALYHHAMGCHLVERIFGPVMTNSDGKEFSPRMIAEEHILQDLGFIPTVSHYLGNMKIEEWMSGTEKHNVRNRRGKHIPLND